MIWFNRFQALLMPDSCQELENIGTKAELSVPSPSILRNRLGSVKARRKASPNIDAPKVAKNKISLINPRTREHIVAPLTTEKLPQNFFI